jgi:hypothetical protein
MKISEKRKVLLTTKKEQCSWQRNRYRVSEWIMKLSVSTSLCCRWESVVLSLLRRRIRSQYTRWMIVRFQQRSAQNILRKKKVRSQYIHYMLYARKEHECRLFFRTGWREENTFEKYTLFILYTVHSKKDERKMTKSSWWQITSKRFIIFM